MTRIAVIADIHGNLPALEAVIDDMQQFNPDHVVVAGDLVNWGPFNRQVLECIANKRVQNGHWAVIRGNNELYLLDADTPRARKEWKSYTMIPWLKKQLMGTWDKWIACLPDTIQLRFTDAPPVRVWHGQPHNPWRGIYMDTPEDEVYEAFADTEEETVILAHTHLPLDRQVGKWHILNCGSVGNPLDGTSGATYMILDGSWDGWQATLRHVDYDIQPMLKEFERINFVEETGVTGRLVIEEFKSDRLQVWPFWRWVAEHYPDQTPTMAMVEEYLLVDNDPYVPYSYSRAALKMAAMNGR